MRHAFLIASVSMLLLALPLSRWSMAQSTVATPATATLSYQSASHLSSDSTPLQFDVHASVRCFDWDSDSDSDLLIGDGEGKIWWVENTSTSNEIIFSSPKGVRAGSVEQWGTGYTGAVFVPIIGSPLPDLVVGHSDRWLSIHENIGTETNPEFSEEALKVEVQDGCQGRFDVADWNGDGHLDLITGSFGGAVQWHAGAPSNDHPQFEPPQSLDGVTVAYNSHPRMVDINLDGKLDLILGVNWGTVSLYLNDGTLDQPRLAPPRMLQWADTGNELTIRSLNEDDTTPDFCDMDRDGVLDLISGGKSGEVFWMRGEGVVARVIALLKLFEDHGDEVGIKLSSSRELRDEAFGILRALHSDLQCGLASEDLRKSIFDRISPLASRHPQILRRNRFDLRTTPHLPAFAAQYWVVLRECLSNDPEDLERLADTLDFTGSYRDLLVDLDVIFIDNNAASNSQVELAHYLMRTIPRTTWDVQTITIAGYLGPEFASTGIRSRSGVNIFDIPLGAPEDSFPADSPRMGVTDVYLICLAHELAHNMLDTVGRRTRPELFERKFQCLEQAAGELVAFHIPKSRGIDMEETKRRFKEAGVWDGEDSSWQQAWQQYFDGKEEFDRAYVRGNVRFFLESPQEAFATLANQYFADSGLMMEFCHRRWTDGHRSNINQMLLFMEYLSEGKDFVKIYTLKPNGMMSAGTQPLERDEHGRISSISLGRGVATFKYDEADMVIDFQYTRR